MWIAADRDDAGKAYAEKVAGLCHEAGAKEVRALQFPAHLVIRDGVPTPREGKIPKGWDLADALDEGWTPELVNAEAQKETIHLTPFEVLAPASESGDSDWQEPMDLLGETLEAAPPFPMEFLPDAFRRYAADVAERMQRHPDYIAIPLVIGAATVTGKEFRLAPKANDRTWAERPCLWGGIISDSGTNKTPAFSYAFETIYRVQHELMEKHKQAVLEHLNSFETADIAEKAWKKSCEKACKDGVPMPDKPKEAEKPPAPVARRIIVGNPTKEGLIDVMEQNPRGMMLFRDELSGWFQTFDQYRKGDDRKFYLECHSGVTHFKDLKGEGNTTLEDPFLTICGGFQPGVIASVLKGGDLDGMTARFSLLVWPDTDPEFVLVDRAPDTKAAECTDKIMRRLFELEPKDVFGELDFNPNKLLQFDADAQAIFNEWYKRTMTRLRSGELDEAMRAHIGKSPGLFARLCIVHHLIRFAESTATSPTRVDAETARQVRRFIDDYLEPHAKRIYRHLGQDPARQGARRIAEWIAKSPDLTEFAARDVRRKNWSGLTEHDSVNRALDYLDNVAAWVRCKGTPPGPKGGRPTTRYLVNPRVRERR
jgi:hypothetical protein